MVALNLTSIPPTNPWHEQLVFKTLHSQFEGGAVSAKKKWLYPKRRINLVFRVLSVTNARTLYDFYKARHGSYQSFVIFHPFSHAYTGEYVGVGDGATSAFNAPGKTISDYSVYVGGVEQTETTNYTIDAAGGSDGEAEINFVSPPASGSHITIDFTGYLKVRCKFAVDEMDFDNFYNTIVNTGIQIMGELNQ